MNNQLAQAIVITINISHPLQYTPHYNINNFLFPCITNTCTIKTNIEDQYYLGIHRIRFQFSFHGLQVSVAVNFSLTRIVTISAGKDSTMAAPTPISPAIIHYDSILHWAVM